MKYDLFFGKRLGKTAYFLHERKLIRLRSLSAGNRKYIVYADRGKT